MNQKKNAHSRYLSQSHQLTTPINDSYPQQKSSPISSLYNRSRLNEITNPDMYYKQSNMDYIKYREQQRNYLNSNYDLMVNNGNYKKKLDVNPYNVNSSSTSLGNQCLYITLYLILYLTIHIINTSMRSLRGKTERRSVIAVL